MDTQKQNAKRSKVQTICRTGERKKPLVEVSIAVLLTLLVAWIFYNAWYGLLWFPVVYLLSSRIYREEKQAKEGQRKNRAFKELLELLSGFLQAGMSLENSFLQAEGQLAMLGEDGKDMIYALHQMNQKVKVNIAVEQAYMELAEQMDLEEACAFGEILLFAKRLGGNYGKNIQRTATKLGEKMSLQEEITTMMAQKKLEMKVMLVIPLAIIAYVRLTSADLLAVLYGNLAGGLIMSVCLVVYVLMALWSRRIMDIVISLIGIVIASPFMLLIVLAIKLYDHGPILYKQERLTKDGKPFMIYKFRSMTVHSEDAGARLAAKGDARVTPVGRVIRAIHFDELPQLFNILKGDMSVVGPRPERQVIADQYTEEIPEFVLRLKVKAGLTGYAQVYGKYNTTPYDKLKLDLTYIENYSVWMDIKILFLTFKILFVRENTEGVDENQTTAIRKESD